MRKNIFAFTLAEVISVVVILGIVAAIIISTTIKNIQKREILTRFQIATSILEDLTQRSLIENGYPNTSSSNNFQTATQIFDTYFRPYLQIAKDCGMGNQYGDDRCFMGPNGGWFALNNGYSDFSAYSQYSYYKVILKNGMSMAFRTIGGGSAGSLYIVVDVNGPKKGYSKLGQDTFLFTYGNEGQLGCGAVSPMLVPGKINFWAWSDFLCKRRNAKNENGGGCNNTAGDAGNGGSALGGANCSILLYMDKKFANDYPWKLASQKPTSYSTTYADGMTYINKYNSKGELAERSAVFENNTADTCKFNKNGKKTECTSIDPDSGDKLVYKYHSNGSTVISCENKTKNENCPTNGYNPLESASYRETLNITGMGADGKPVSHKTVWKFRNKYSGIVWCEEYAHGVVPCPAGL